MHDCEMITVYFAAHTWILLHPNQHAAYQQTPVMLLQTAHNEQLADIEMQPIDYVCAHLLYYCMCYYLGETLEVWFSLASFKRSYQILVNVRSL